MSNQFVPDCFYADRRRSVAKLTKDALADLPVSPLSFPRCGECGHRKDIAPGHSTACSKRDRPSFREQLAKNIVKCVRAFARDQTTGASEACIRQNTESPSYSLAGAPGLHGQTIYITSEHYKQIFREVLATVKLPRGFSILK